MLQRQGGGQLHQERAGSSCTSRRAALANAAQPAGSVRVLPALPSALCNLAEGRSCAIGLQQHLQQAGRVEGGWGGTSLQQRHRAASGGKPQSAADVVRAFPAPHRATHGSQGTARNARFAVAGARERAVQAPCAPQAIQKPDEDLYSTKLACRPTLAAAGPRTGARTAALIL